MNYEVTSNGAKNNSSADWGLQQSYSGVRTEESHHYVFMFQQVKENTLTDHNRTKMIIKLVRTDETFPSKVKLLRGKHVFGRGKLLDCDDKRISRQHGQLLVNDDSLTLTALHQNPCFFQKKGSTETEILKINSTTVLNNGDKFGLLPGLYWYEVIVCMDDNSEQNADCISENDTEELDLDNTSCENTRKETNNEELIINDNCDDKLDTSERSDSPSLLPSTSEATTHNQNESLEPGNEPTPHASKKSLDLNLQKDIQENNAPNQDSEGTKNSPSKRCHSPDDVDTKKIKIEDEIKSEPTVKVEQTVKAEPSQDATPGGSTNQMNPANNINNVGAPQVVPVQPRERCMYGAQCYRRNPNHLSQFSHPQDGDWGPGERGVCPYGASCRRKNPSHWRDHDHPPGTLPPPPNQGPRRQRIPDRNIPPPDLPPKRVRKMVPRQEWNDSGSDPEHDPYETDESDEWEPESSGSFFSEEYL